MTHPKALVYAEDVLKVHQTWLDAQELHLQIGELYNTLAGLDANVRKLNTDMDRRRNEIFANIVESNTGLSVAAMERLVKVEYGKDKMLQDLVDEYNSVSSHRDMIQSQIRSKETNHKGHVARLNELGGYFHYLGTTKLVQMQSQLPY